MQHFLSSADLLLPYYISASVMAAEGVMFCKRGNWRSKSGRRSKEKKKTRGEERERSQLVIAGLQLTLSFYKGLREEEMIGELKECSDLASPQPPPPLMPPLISTLAKQGMGGREWVSEIKLQTFSHLIVGCHVGAFLHLCTPP